MMSNLSVILIVKIAITAILWGGPLLLLPSSLLSRIGFPLPEPQLFLRLLGVAYWALLAGYVFGLRVSLQGGYPAEAIWVGIISNGGAFILLTAGAIRGIWSSWGVLAQVVMWGSVLGTGFVTTGLIWFGPLGMHE